MNNQKRAEYVKEWRKRNVLRLRMHKLRWYYKNRVMINLMYSRPKSANADEYDKFYLEQNPQG